jgi:hypothetical protein
LTPRRAACALWLWPNYLSLDAPLVAVLWQILFARCFRVPSDFSAAALLVAAVWLIYSADRMLDARRDAGLRLRHWFYRRHWRVVLAVWGVVFAAAASSSWLILPRWLFDRGLLLLGAVAVYLAMVHAAPARVMKGWPKEALVAILFALGATVAAWSDFRNRSDLLAVILFCCLCWINCAAIERWEGRELRRPLRITAAAVGLAALLLLHSQRPVLCAAESASAFAFVFLDWRRPCLSPDVLRVLADAALLSPIFLLPVAGTLL